MAKRSLQGSLNKLLKRADNCCPAGALFFAELSLSILMPLEFTNKLQSHWERWTSASTHLKEMGELNDWLCSWGPALKFHKLLKLILQRANRGNSVPAAPSESLYRQDLRRFCQRFRNVIILEVSLADLFQQTSSNETTSLHLLRRDTLVPVREKFRYCGKTFGFRAGA